MYCRHCGNKVEEASRFCNLCGKELSVRDTENAIIARENDADNQCFLREATSRKPSCRTVRIAFLCTAIIIFTAMTLILALPSKKNTVGNIQEEHTQQIAWEEKITAIHGTKYDTILKTYLHCVEDDNTSALLDLYHDRQEDMIYSFYKMDNENEEITDSAMVSYWDGFPHEGYYNEQKGREIDTYEVISMENYDEESFDEYDGYSKGMTYSGIGYGDMDHTYNIINIYLYDTMDIDFYNVVRICFQCKFKGDDTFYRYVMELVEIDRGEWNLFNVQFDRKIW